LKFFLFLIYYKILKPIIQFNLIQHYGNLFFLLQTEPQYIANLARLVTMAEMDTLLQTVMFTVFGNQYDSREEYLLLTVFQVFFLFFLIF